MRRLSIAQSQRRARRTRRGGFLVGVIAFACLAAAALAACGDETQTPAANGAAAPTAMQVLTEVTRGDLTETTTGRIAGAVVDEKTTKVVATVAQENASAVDVGQKATVVFLPSGSTRPSGAPEPQGSPGVDGVPTTGPSGAPSSGDGQPGASGDGDAFGRGDLGDGGISGTVTAVSANSDGSVAVTIKLDEAPTDVEATDESTGMALIQTTVLASDVVIVPTDAITGTGDSATVQVLANGTTSSRDVVVGQQAGGMTEIVSGLEVGESVVWSRSFSAGRGFASPGAGQDQMGPGMPTDAPGLPQGGTEQ
ncbi:MAG: hypothetical protein R2826_01780 [Thermoleophilia bacterium]